MEQKFHRRRWKEWNGRAMRTGEVGFGYGDFWSVEDRIGVEVGNGFSDGLMVEVLEE